MYVDSADADNASTLRRLQQIRRNFEASIHHSEDEFLSKFDEIERLLCQIGEASEFPLRLELQSEQVEQQITLGTPLKQITAHFGVSLKTLKRRIAQWGLRRNDMNAKISDYQLDQIVFDIHRQYPSAGYKMMLPSKHLNIARKRIPTLKNSSIRAIGQSRRLELDYDKVKVCAVIFCFKEIRVLESLRRVDPEGILMRKLSLQTLQRRHYCVPAPNSLWHIDGNHKLIRWRVVVHGGIDGFSCLVYLTAATNNRAQTVLESFLSAAEQYGIPSRVRSDKGGENILVARFMVTTCGLNRNSHIAGRSVQSERMWRDVFENVLNLFYATFLRLEAEGWLNPDKDADLYALYRCYMPHIQAHLQQFQAAWKNHSLRSARNQSPVQLWLSKERDSSAGFSQIQHEQRVERSGIQRPVTDGVHIPELELPRPLTQEELTMLPSPSVALSETLPVYIETVQLLREMLDM